MRTKILIALILIYPLWGDPVPAPGSEKAPVDDIQQKLDSVTLVDMLRNILRIPFGTTAEQEASTTESKPTTAEVPSGDKPIYSGAASPSIGGDNDPQNKPSNAIENRSPARLWWVLLAVAVFVAAAFHLKRRGVRERGRGD